MIPKDHPRYESLKQRHKIAEGVKEGYVTPTGMIAQGRGEAFDYLLGEKTIKSAEAAEKAAVYKLKNAKKPIISVNGNVAALCAKEVVELAINTNAGIEINLFYWTAQREKKIAAILKKAGAKKIYSSKGVKKKIKLKVFDSPRAFVDPEGIAKADTVLVMLEDGDRTEALKKLGKFVIAIDLNPLSRTAQTADITIVDNIVRALPNMIRFAKEDFKIKSFDNKKIIQEAVSKIKQSI